MPELVVGAPHEDVDAARGPRHGTRGSTQDAAERCPPGPGPVVIGFLHQALVRAAGKDIEVVRAPGGDRRTRGQAAVEFFPGEPWAQTEPVDQGSRRNVEPA